MDKTYKDMWFELKANLQGGLEYYASLIDIQEDESNDVLYIALENKKIHLENTLSMINAIEKEKTFKGESKTYHKGGCI